MMENISYINIDNKSQEEQIKWQNEFEKISYTTFNKGYGIIVLQSPTGSGKTWAIHNLLKSKKVDNNTVVIKKNSVKVKDQWENYGIDSVSLHTDILNHNDLINHINGKKKYDDLKVVVFDEAHENYALLLCGHGCHIRHQGSNYLDKLKERYSKNKTLQSIYNLAREKILILVSDTLDSLICEELPMYSGIFPIDIVVVKPTDNYYEILPSSFYHHHHSSVSVFYSDEGSSSFVVACLSRGCDGSASVGAWRGTLPLSTVLVPVSPTRPARPPVPLL